MALCALVLSPLMLIASTLQAKTDKGVNLSTGDSLHKDEADVLASDAIANFKTVASFGCDTQICSKYHELNEKSFLEEEKRLQKHAFSYALSQFM